MPHRLLVPQTRRLEPRIRLPMPQHPGEAVAQNLQDTLIDTDSSLRRVKGTNPSVCTGPLPSMQVFVVAGPGGTNTPESMSSGLRKANAARLVSKTRGQSAGA